MPKLFGQKLAYLRTQDGLSQSALSRTLSLASPAHVNNMEAGRRAPTIDLVLRVANAFEVATDYLVFDTLFVEEPVGTTFGPSPVPQQLAGAKVKYVRRQRGLKQRDIAERLGIRTQAQLSQFETGRYNASLTLLLAIARLLDVSTDYLLRDNIAITHVLPRTHEEKSG